MYFDAKVLIPFIPLCIILLGDCYEELCAGQRSYRIIFGIFIIVYAAGAVFYDGSVRYMGIYGGRYAGSDDMHYML